MKIITLLLAIIFTATSCMTDSKLRRHAQIYYAEHPEELAQLCGDKYPPIVLPGVAITKHDTTTIAGVSIPCPDAKIDSVTGKIQKVYVRCPDSKIVHDSTFIHDTIINNALVEACQLKYGIQNKELVDTKARLEERNKTARQEAIGLVILILVCGGLTFAYFKK